MREFNFRLGLHVMRYIIYYKTNKVPKNNDFKQTQERL